MGSPEYESFHRTGRQYQPNDYSQNPFPAVGVSILIAIGLLAGLHWLVSQCARWLMPVLLLLASMPPAMAAELQEHVIVMTIPRDKVETQIIESPFDLSDVDASIEVWDTFKFQTRLKQDTETIHVNSTVTSYQYSNSGTYDSPSNHYYVHEYTEGEDAPWTATYEPIRVEYKIPPGKNQAGKIYVWRLPRLRKQSGSMGAFRFTEKSDWIRSGPF